MNMFAHKENKDENTVLFAIPLYYYNTNQNIQGIIFDLRNLNVL